MFGRLMIRCCRIGSSNNNNIIITNVSSSRCSNRRWFHGTSIVAAKFRKKLTVEGLAKRVKLEGQNVLVRVDLNVPLAEDNVTVTDDTRLQAIVPTTRFLLNEGANVILCSHFGRPKGKVIESGKNGRLNPIVPYLQELLLVGDGDGDGDGDSDGGDGRRPMMKKIQKVNDCIGKEVEQVAHGLSTREVLVLENTRFHPEETNNDPIFSQQLSRLANYFVMDAFGTAHRAHASTVGVTHYMKYNAVGYLMEKELQYLQGVIQEEDVDVSQEQKDGRKQTQRPLVAILGGSKVSTKLTVIEALLEKCDAVLLGGAMIFTFFKAMGYNVGASLVEDDMVEMAHNLLEHNPNKNKLILPMDVVLADQFHNNAKTMISNIHDIPNGNGGVWRGLDIGPQTIELFRKHIHNANTIVWNGPMGVFEFPNFATGTMQLLQMLIDATKTRHAITIVGGGDSVAAIKQGGFHHEQFSHISTGGGATLQLLEGKVLPGVEALTDE